jgi:hypothetical protein
MYRPLVGVPIPRITCKLHYILINYIEISQEYEQHRRNYMAKDADQKPIDSSLNPYSNDIAPGIAHHSTGQAIRELPGQYLKVLTRPSVASFAGEKGKARWSIVWVQLISLAIIDAILQVVSLQISPPNPANIAGLNSISPSMLQSITVITTVLFVLVLTPVSFLVAGGILYLLARAFGGNGTFLEQIYTTLLFGVPLVILSFLLQLIPATSSWLPYLPHLYSLALFVVSLMAVHHLSRGKALAVIFIPMSILLVLVLAGTIMLTILAKH